jgi:hypothetical protein
MQNSYCDHRNFDSVNQPFKKSVIRKCTSFRVPELAISVIGCTQKCWTIIVETYISNCFTVPWNKTKIIIDPSVKNLRLYYKSSLTLTLKEWRFNSWLVVIVLYLTKRLLALQLLSSNHKFMLSDASGNYMVNVEIFGPIKTYLHTAQKRQDRSRPFHM